MKITKELLNKHSKGLCSEEERIAVEEWFEMDEVPATGLRMFRGKEVNKERIWSRVLQDLPLMGNQSGSTRTIPLYKKLTRYAAAVCIIFAAFFGGRLSTGTANANPVMDKTPKDHLYITGGNGAKGNLPGESFNVKFDGNVRLFNGASGQKSIQVGDTCFILESHQTYYLSGSLEKPQLLSYWNVTGENYQNTKPEGYFSIRRTDKK